MYWIKIVVIKIAQHEVFCKIAMPSAEGEFFLSFVNLQVPSNKSFIDAL